MADCLWTPSKERVSESLLANFMRDYGPFDDYDAIWQWSVEDRATFWSAVWDFAASSVTRAIRHCPRARICWTTAFSRTRV
jgi:hypothetical protein